MLVDAAPLWFGVLSEDLAHAVRQRTSAWLGKVLRVSALVLVTSGLLGVATNSHPSWTIYASFALAIAVALLLDIARRPRAAAIALSLGFWLVATAAVFLLGGVRSPGTFVYLPIVVTAALFWSWGAAAALTAATLVVEIAALWLDTAGLLPPPLQIPTNGPLLRIFAGSLTMTAVLVGVALHCLRGALADIRRYALRTEELLVESPDVIASFDRLGVVLAVTESLRARTGYLPGEVVGRHHSRIDLFAGDRILAADEIRRIADGGLTSRPIELRRKDGSVLWGEARKQLLAVDDLEPLVRVVLHDVTRRKLAEDRRAELEKLIDRSKRLEAMGLLVGGITHDLNNLLTVILSGSQVLELQLPDDSPAREIVRDVTDSANRATALARQLLEARPKDGVTEAIDVSSEIEELRPILSRLMGEGIELVLRVDRDPCLVRVDPMHLEQIALNLVANARDAMPNGGEVIVETARGVDSNGTTGGVRRLVEISVTDSGVGMDDATRQRVFEPFFTTKGRAGTGIGLATVDGIVTGLGGQIRVESQPGRGTCVKVLLPEAEDIARAGAKQTVGGIRPA